MKENIPQLDPRIAELLAPQNTAVIVVDMMDAYCDTSAPLPRYLIEFEKANFDYLETVAESIDQFIEVSKEFSLKKYVFVRMIERRDSVTSNIALKMQIDEVPDVVEKNGFGWSYYKVKPSIDDKEIGKSCYDAFMNTDLDSYLKSIAVTTVIIVGGYASVCIDTTARTAAQLGYHTFVPADLVADPGMNGEEQNPDIIRRKLYAINNVMGYMPSSEQIIAYWKSLQK